MPKRTRNGARAIAATLGMAYAMLVSQALAAPPPAPSAPAPPAPAASAPPPPAPAASAPPPPALAPSAPSQGASTVAPDLIRLKNGGMLRGMIAESGGDLITIVLLTGETRKVPASEVTYAGPASAAPSAAPVAAPATAPSPADPGRHPFATVHAAAARVSFVSVPTGSSLSRRSGSASFTQNGSASAIGYNEVCTAPCVASMPAGTHTFAVAKPEGSPIEAKPVTLPAGDSTLTAKYVDKSSSRVGFAIMGTAAMVGGLVLELSALPSSADPDSSIDPGPFFGGLALQAGGLVLILCARYVKDRFELSVAPGSGPALPTPAPAANDGARAEPRFLDRPGASTATVRDGLAGLHVTGHF